MFRRQNLYGCLYFQVGENDSCDIQEFWSGFSATRLVSSFCATESTPDIFQSIKVVSKVISEKFRDEKIIFSRRILICKVNTVFNGTPSLSRFPGQFGVSFGVQTAIVINHPRIMKVAVFFDRKCLGQCF